MRKLVIPARMLGEPMEAWLQRLILELTAFSEEQVETVFDGFTVEGYNEVRTLDASTATATDVADFLCTLIADIQKRGSFTETGI